MHLHKSFASFVCGPENRAALLALQDLADDLVAGNEENVPNPIYLHGPTGTGKTHLVQALLQEITCKKTSLTANIWDAASLEGESAHGILETACDSDLVVLEDLQHLARPWVEPLIQLLDDRLNRGQPTIFTARTGLKNLSYRGERLCHRLTSRLATGLVIALEPLGPAGRLLILKNLAQRRQLALPQEVLTWLANNLTGGGRQLEGAINQLELLARLHHQPLDVEAVAGHLRDQIEAARPTVERIALRVSRYFRVKARQLQSRQRYRNILLPRQVGMYLARRLTGLSLEQIGAYFGGRDHSTVLHACRKVEEAIGADAGLSGAVRQIHAELT
jgi:chromosomal replication initiator protein